VSEITKLPRGWLELPLSEVIQTQKGKKPKDLGEESATRAIPYINIKAFEHKIVTEYAPEQDAVECNEHDTLLVWDGARAGLSGNGISGYVGSTLARVRSDLVDSRFLSYYFESIYSLLNTQTKGVGIPHINPTVLFGLPFLLPPEAEQPRIVEKLDELLSELDFGVQELKAAQVKLKHYRQSLLKSAVEGALTQKWRDDNKHQIEETGKELLNRILIERKQRWEQNKLEEFKEKGKKPPKNWQDKYPEPVQPDTTDLPELPEGWVWASLDQCIEQAKDITDGPFGSNLKTEHYIESGPRVIRLQNIGDGEFLNDKAHISKERYNNLIKHAVEPNDILIAMMGEDLPRACLPPNDISPAIVKADCARVRLNNEIVNSHLVMHFLNSIPVRSRTKSAVKGVGRPRINLGYIRSIAIPIPPQLEQTALLTEINNQLDSVNRQFVASEISLKQSEVQRKNILKSAFSGELVSQDENDEPAFSLLEAIKKEREEQAKQAKPSKKRQTKKKVDVMNTLLEVLTAEDRWIDAQEAFKKCGIVNGSSIDRVEEIYAELRKLEKSGQIEIERNGSYDQIRFIKQEIKED